ncbi:hypothetical protein SLU01_35720 [Sporosarcina luteola]|uniref:Uncharacterized protein n=1 Tax=Sporosarcina luteola TaxID=582850 RepID=A0A511ZCT2_9BACL|nr:hypothetical protein [Sporosarcina luteola]GEN85260.1 hypothetical protein SLU01_35720 [Sporosarcina luteola]
MGALSKNVKEELANALNDKNAAMFVAEGKLFSLEVHEPPFMDEEYDDLVENIESYPELKESLQRYYDNPEMQRFTAKELKELRHERRK